MRQNLLTSTVERFTAILMKGWYTQSRSQAEPIVFAETACSDNARSLDGESSQSKIYVTIMTIQTFCIDLINQ
jgi:hypothetical protein